MKRLIPLMMAAMLALGSIATADDLLGRGGKGGGKSGGSGGGSSGGGGKSTPPPPTRNTGGGSGGGKSTPPPSRNTGGGNSGGLSFPSRGGSSNSGSSQSRTNSNSQENRGYNGVLSRQGGSSRSGNVSYNSRNNQTSNNSSRSVTFNAPPTVRSNSRISNQAYQEGRNVSRTDPYRNGYYQYSNQWVDNNFWYPHYTFNYTNNCVPSPFYYYPNLPGYINVVRVRIGDFSFSWSTGDRYDWRYDRNRGNDGWGWGNDRRDDRYDRDLDYAIDDIYDAFRNRSVRSMSNLIPTRSRVGIELDRYAQYSIDSDDFYDMMRDLIEGTDTRNYIIRDVRYSRGQATVVADHEYRDPWGRTQRTRHYYGLREERRGYSIVSFRIDN
ncbi:MAG: hypothetical protein R2688_08370 [Fimbriimonadaceae bacterium]